VQAEVDRVLALAGRNGVELAAWVDYVSQWKLTQDPSHAIRQTFRLLDRDATGFLSRDDWREAVSSVAPHVQPGVVDDAFDAVDSNRDNRIDCDEFVALWAALTLYS